MVLCHLFQFSFPPAIDPAVTGVSGHGATGREHKDRQRGSHGVSHIHIEVQVFQRAVGEEDGAFEKVHDLLFLRGAVLLEFLELPQDHFCGITAGNIARFIPADAVCHHEEDHFSIGADGVCEGVLIIGAHQPLMGVGIDHAAVKKFDSVFDTETGGLQFLQFGGIRILQHGSFHSQLDLCLRRPS